LKTDSKNKYTVSDVVGWSRADGEELTDYIVKTCGAKRQESWTLIESIQQFVEYGKPVVVEDGFATLEGSASERKLILGDNGT
jgi:hypothetical protein